MIAVIRREPALVSGLVTALIALGVAFGLPVTPEQTGAILAVDAAVLAFVVRSQVTPGVSVAAQQDRPTSQPVAGPAAEDGLGIEQGTPVEVIPGTLPTTDLPEGRVQP